MVRSRAFPLQFHLDSASKLIELVVVGRMVDVHLTTMFDDANEPNESV